MEPILRWQAAKRKRPVSTGPDTSFPGNRSTTISSDRYLPAPSMTWSKGGILASRQMRWRYCLNASLQRLGLPTVAETPVTPSSRSVEDTLQMAFTLIDPVVFSSPP